MKHGVRPLLVFVCLVWLCWLGPLWWRNWRRVVMEHRKFACAPAAKAQEAAIPVNRRKPDWVIKEG